MAEHTTTETQKDTSETERATDVKELGLSSVPKQSKILLLGGFALVFLLFLSIAFTAGRHYSENREYIQSSRLQLPVTQMGQAGGDGFRGGMMRGSLDENSTTSNTRFSGVVTAVSGDTITVAGNGATTKVLVSSNTTYTGGTEPAKVNDTITALGAKDSNDSLVASAVYLARQ